MPLPSGSSLVYTQTIAITTVTDSGFTPPENCCDNGCRVDADDVQVFYWPKVRNETKHGNASIVARAAPYSIVSDGKTLQVPPF